MSEARFGLDAMGDVKTPEAVIDLIKAFTDRYEGSDFSFAHIVLGDFNLGDGHIEHCVQDEVVSHYIVDALQNQGVTMYQFLEMVHATYDFMWALLRIPEAIRERASEIHNS